MICDWPINSIPFYTHTIIINILNSILYTHKKFLQGFITFAVYCQTKLTQTPTTTIISPQSVSGTGICVCVTGTTATWVAGYPVPNSYVCVSPPATDNANVIDPQFHSIHMLQ